MVATNTTYACMFTFHRAAPAAGWAQLPNRNFYLNLDYLERLLRYLRRSQWEIVTIDAMLERIGGTSGVGRLVNFSVDDCYRDTFAHVLPLFRRLGVPVTLFVTTGIPDGTDPLGWAGLETILAERQCITVAGQSIDLSRLAAKRSWFWKLGRAWEKADFNRAYGDFCRRNSVDPTRLRDRHAITWEMLAAIKDDPLVEIGAHTVSHPRISALALDPALHELADSGARIRLRLGVPCRHFAFPYGRSKDCGARDFRLARAAGFASAATTVRGLVTPRQDRFSLPRNNLNGAFQSIAYAKASLIGLSAFAARVLRNV
jgi:peptidoglycan/xylan/chitin deacetylase (PgdA/CDA1 family)